MLTTGPALRRQEPEPHPEWHAREQQLNRLRAQLSERKGALEHERRLREERRLLEELKKVDEEAESLRREQGYVGPGISAALQGVALAGEGGPLAPSAAAGQPIPDSIDEAPSRQALRQAPPDGRADEASADAEGLQTAAGASSSPTLRHPTPLSVPRGWRLDLIEIGPKGIGQLVIHEGYYVGEKAMFEILAKNGFRYRMRATTEEMKKGVDVPPISQLGPLKLRLFESLGGSCRKPGLVRPEGYRGCAGLAAWDTDLPKANPALK
ncbi:unnamed protein product [Prorocentrum cordatum]|uniref:Uncharacterized protein n=1 Tax=Prorocentrum cordatum TaxID=2364126 RepID=A0ABN9RPX3_9DINO|nr:unnamed protein product [Polarella glacialis]